MTACNSSPTIKDETRYLYPDYIACNQPQRMTASIKEGSIIISANSKYVELKGEIFYKKFQLEKQHKRLLTLLIQNLMQRLVKN